MINYIPDASTRDSLPKAIARAVDQINYAYEKGSPEHDAAMTLLRSEVRSIKRRQAAGCRETARRYDADATGWEAIAEP